MTTADVGDQTDPWSSPHAVRAMVVAEHRVPSERAIRAALEFGERARSRITIAVVARPDIVAVAWDSLGGTQLVHGHSPGCEISASRMAYLGAANVHRDICADHRAVCSWREILEIAMDEGYDLVVLDGRPSQRRDRRLVSAAAARFETATLKVLD